MLLLQTNVCDWREDRENMLLLNIEMQYIPNFTTHTGVFVNMTENDADTDDDADTTDVNECLSS